MCTQHAACLPLLVTLRYRQRFRPFSAGLRFVTLTRAGREFISGSAAAVSRFDALHVPAMKKHEAKHEDAREAEHDGEKRGIPAF